MQDASYPRRWDWKADGATADGHFVRISEGHTAYGTRPVLVLRIDGEERSVWMLELGFRTRVADEVTRRPRHDLEVGERITVTRGEKAVSKATGNHVWPFKIVFHDAPKRSALDILNGSNDEPPTPASAITGQTDVIPF